MWNLGDTQDNFADQIEIYKDIIEQKTEELDGLQEAGKSASNDVHRDKLTEEINQAKIQVLQLRENAEREGREVDGGEMDRDFFTD